MNEKYTSISRAKVKVKGRHLIQRKREQKGVVKVFTLGSMVALVATSQMTDLVPNVIGNRDNREPRLPQESEILEMFHLL